MKDRINVSFQRGQKRKLESGQIEYSLFDAFSVLDKIKVKILETKEVHIVCNVGEPWTIHLVLYTKLCRLQI